MHSYFSCGAISNRVYILKRKWRTHAKWFYNKGEKSHPTSFTVSRCLSSFTNSPAAAATPTQEEEDEFCEAWVVLQTEMLKYADNLENNHHQKLSTPYRTLRQSMVDNVN